VRSVAILVALAALAASPASAAQGPATQDRYLAWLELEVTDSWRRDRTTVEDGCTKRSNHDLTQRLSLRSRSQSVLVVTRKGSKKSVGGTLNALVGSLSGSGGGIDSNSCDLYSVITDRMLPVAGPVTIAGAALDVRATPGKAVAFSNLRRIAPRWQQTAGSLANIAARASGSLTADQLRRAKTRKVEVAGSYADASTSADGAESRSVTVAWRLTLRALPRRP
jgi:opacity protein-like surface antigen